MGASTSIELPIGGDAKFIGVSSDGLTEQREALENDRGQASELGANLLSSSKGAAKEAEETLKIRVAARTASITTIVKAGAEGLQTILRKIAEWMNLNPEDVTVTPNMDFVPDVFVPKDLLDFMAAKNAGAPFSLESIHNWGREQGITEMEFEEEMKKIEEEDSQQEDNEDPEEQAARELMLQQFRESQQNPQDPENPDSDPEDNPEENEDE